jgi:hypothetical protein
VPSASMADPIRIVIDETSFDFREVSAGSMECYLDEFSDAVWDLRADGITVWKSPMLDLTPVTDDSELFEYLAGAPGYLIDRDTRNRFFGLVGKCPEWEEPQSVALDVELARGEPIMALSIGYALISIVRGHAIACLVFGACDRRGMVSAASSAGSAEVFFFAVAPELKEFWRSLYECEDVQEQEFFALARRAFPELLFSPDLRFRRFDGTYRDLREHVVRHLAVLNDHFISTYFAANGIASEIEATLASVGCPGASPESPKTHGNARAMAQRDVDYQGATVRCEWHTKIEPHRNRIHFAFGGGFGAKIFVGIFADHLGT